MSLASYPADPRLEIPFHLMGFSNEYGLQPEELANDDHQLDQSVDDPEVEEVWIAWMVSAYS